MTLEERQMLILWQYNQNTDGVHGLPQEYGWNIMKGWCIYIYYIMPQLKYCILFKEEVEILLCFFAFLNCIKPEFEEFCS